MESDYRSIEKTKEVWVIFRMRHNLSLCVEHTRLVWFAFDIAYVLIVALSPAHWLQAFIAGLLPIFSD